MAVDEYHYYVISKVNDKDLSQSFSNVDDIVNHIHQSAILKGAFGIKEFDNLHVIYDSHEGRVYLSGGSKYPSIFSTYDKTIEDVLTGLISQAVKIYAKFFLLRNINELDDADPIVSDLKKIILDYRIRFDKDAVIDAESVNLAVSQICYHLKKNAKHLNDLSHDTIEAIYNLCSLNDANKVSADLKAKCSCSPAKKR